MKSGGNQAKSILEIDKFTIVWGKWIFIREIFRFEILEAKQKFGENLFHRPRRLGKEGIRPRRRAWIDEKRRRSSEIYYGNLGTGFGMIFESKLRSLRSRSPNALTIVCVCVLPKLWFQWGMDAPMVLWQKWLLGKFKARRNWGGLKQHGFERRASKKAQKRSKSEKTDAHVSIQYQFHQIMSRIVTFITRSE